ncbi:MAG: leucine--tRNA ligase [Flavobacteriales bacterium]|nr:leucine--tRNA ligase [Flavobacteriales bacterium]
MEYNPNEIEKKWQRFWAEKKTFIAKNPKENSLSKPKFYVLDMFPYPSGAGLHVGHPLGYIASDVIARYKRHKGFNVLHPMGYDAFGLPAEQYAIQTGQHPDKTTKENIARYREQLDKIGFSFDWEREVRTCDSGYYKWTQWIFLKLYNSWYNPISDKAEPIETLMAIFEKEGFRGNLNTVLTGGIEKDLENFTAEKWKKFDEVTRELILMNFRLAYLSEAYVNWCPAMGTVLANDEVKDGVSERGGYPVERKLMKQWSLRITAYANRLLIGLDSIEWSESIKEAQKNWIGKSEGCTIAFEVENTSFKIEVFTTRPDTIFGVSYLTLAPELDLVPQITSANQKSKVETYITYATNRNDRERQSDVKNITGEFTGAYAIHPFTRKKIPIWIGDYVLSGYGTGAVMAVPAHDTRDHAFAKHFKLPIQQVVECPANWNINDTAYDEKKGKIINSEFLNGLDVKEAITQNISEIEKRGFGKHKTNFRLRDAVFGRQRYWGEPIPIYYKNGIPCPLKEDELPLLLPEVDKYLPTEDGEPPLARAKNWKYQNQYNYEHTTMPGWAGSSWYFLRYMDVNNAKEFASKEALEYWKEIDLYIGGAEHATGHLLYFRFWTKFLKDLGYINIEEPAKKLINQGMIQGVSEKIMLNKSFTAKTNRIAFFASSQPDMLYVDENNKEQTAYIYYSKDVADKRGFETVEKYVPISIVQHHEILPEKIQGLKQMGDFEDAVFVCEGGYWYKGRFKRICEGSDKFYTKPEVEKMSKSKFNVVNPDELCEKYGADTLRLYEMFLGPLEDHKPWSTASIEGVFRFLKKLWRLFYDENGVLKITDEEPTKDELKILHKCIKRVTEDIERFSFNTVVSNYMICVNELSDIKCNKKNILKSFLIILSPYAPHIAEELWEKTGENFSIEYEAFPVFIPAYLEENRYTYPIQFNGKLRFTLNLSLSLSPSEIEKEVLGNDQTQKYLNGVPPKKVIVVPKKIVNIVV